MVKLFKIIEKIVWVIAALAIVLVVIMMVYGIIANTQQGWQKVIPYLYLAAFLFAIYKAVVIFFTSFYKIQITKRQEYLDAIKGIGGEGVYVIPDNVTEHGGQTGGQTSGQTSGQTDIDATIAEVLRLIKENPKITRKMLSNSIGVAPSTISISID